MYALQASGDFGSLSTIDVGLVTNVVLMRVDL